MNQKPETEFVAFVGIDWADQKHAFAMQIPGHREVERGDLDHTPETVDVWADLATAPYLSGKRSGKAGPLTSHWWHTLERLR